MDDERLIETSDVQYFSMDSPGPENSEPSSFQVPPGEMTTFELAHLRMLEAITYSLADIAMSLRKLTRADDQQQSA